MLVAAVLVMAAGIALELAHAATGFGGSTGATISDDWAYSAVELVALAMCATRAVRRREHRAAWTLMAVGLACWTAGDLMWALWLDNLTTPPFPSAADVVYLCMYPAMYGTLMLLMRSGLRDAASSQWLDGGVVGLTAAAIAALLVFSDITAHAGGRFVAEAVTVAYPVADFVLLICVGVAYSLLDWRPGRDWLLLGCGVLAMAIADIAYADQVARGAYDDSSLLNAGYLLSFSLMACAAWMPGRRTGGGTRYAPHTILLTCVAAAVALGLLVVAAFHRVTPLAVGLAAGALVLGGARAGLTYAENARMLRRSARTAVTDALTGLGNRRRLMADLQDIAAADGRWTIAFLDLNGFKRYNDTFGHAAGDALLARLAGALREVIGDRGQAYRLGGDEFCVLLEGHHPRHDRAVAAAVAACAEHGPGFDVTAAVGVAIVPDDVRDPNAALQLADERMYADKSRGNRSQTRDVLMALLDERTPELAHHVSDVASLTEGVAVQMQLSDEQRDEVMRAAELHDIGKLAVPDRILDKPGPLDEEEWAFVRQHPVIGERILAASPALASVARMVRASHERWDGLGYPDGLAGDQIPLGARIVAACDAYDAIVSDRAYQRSRTPQEALAELRRHAGDQFDPQVISAMERHFAAFAHAPGQVGVR